MSAPAMTGGEVAAALFQVQDAQYEILRLKSERDRLIRELRGQVPVRVLARHLGLSAAQVSRIGSTA